MTARCAQTLQPESRAADRRPENFNNRGFAGPIHIRHKIIALLFAHLYPVEIERSAIDDLSSAARGFDCGVEHRMHMDPLLVLKKQTILARIKSPMFHRTRFVLVESSHPGNIGAAARALKTMGCTRLILVKPRTPRAHQHPDALAMASGAGDVLARAEMAASLDEALADVQWSVALSAR